MPNPKKTVLLLGQNGLMTDVLQSVLCKEDWQLLRSKWTNEQWQSCVRLHNPQTIIAFVGTEFSRKTLSYVMAVLDQLILVAEKAQVQHLYLVAAPADETAQQAYVLLMAQLLAWCTAGYRHWWPCCSLPYCSFISGLAWVTISWACFTSRRAFSISQVISSWRFSPVILPTAAIRSGMNCGGRKMNRRSSTGNCCRPIMPAWIRKMPSILTGARGRNHQMQLGTGRFQVHLDSVFLQSGAALLSYGGSRLYAVPAQCGGRAGLRLCAGENRRRAQRRAHGAVRRYR